VTEVPSDPTEPADAGPPDRRRELRNNLIFLVIILALTLPGIVLITGKALRGEGGLSSAPPARRVETPYLHQVQTADHVKRSVPPQTLAWVDELARKYVGADADRIIAAGNRPTPRIGDRQWIELIALDPPVALLWQHGEGPDPSDVTVVADDFSDRPAEVLAVEPVPMRIREELQAFGMPAPPRRVTVLSLPTPADGAEALELTWRRGTEAGADRVAWGR
jgi:hypothetical protein